MRLTNWLLGAVLVPVLGIGSTWAASNTHGHRVTSAPPTSSDGPPHMIEIAPGNWVSSYQCVVRDGNRLISCDSLRSGI